MKDSVFKRQGYLWITLILFLASFLGQWISHTGSATEFANAVLENWQSEFLQLIWQVAGLSILFAVGSPQSKNESDRLEEKVDHLIILLDPHGGEEYIESIDYLHDRS